MKKLLVLCMLCCILLPSLASCDRGSVSGESNSVQQESTAPEDATPIDTSPEQSAAQASKYTVDFADGKMDFVMVNTAIRGTDSAASAEIIRIEETNALAMTTPGGKDMRLGINVDGLLGEKVTEVKTIELLIYAMFPDEKFHAVGGEIAAMSGDKTAFKKDTWTVYIDTRNPNRAILEFGDNEGFTAAGPNIIEFSCLTNGPVQWGQAPAVICIQAITFYDALGVGLEVNTDALWSAPEGYGESTAVIADWNLPVESPYGDPTWEIYYTPGTDDRDDPDVDYFMPWEVVNASIGIVFEMEDPQAGGYTFVHFGEYNNWGWTEIKDYDLWSDGVLTIMWDDIGLEPTAITQDNSALKFQLGNWNNAQVTAVYLLYDTLSVSN